MTTTPATDRTATQDRTGRIIQTGILIEQNVEARYLRVGRAFTYGPIRRLFEEYAAEVRDHARILSRHLRDREGGPRWCASSGRRRRPRAAEGPPILNPVSLYQSFDEAFRAAERAIVFHRRATSQVDDSTCASSWTCWRATTASTSTSSGHLLADIRDRAMHLTPGPQAGAGGRAVGGRDVRGRGAAVAPRPRASPAEPLVHQLHVRRSRVLCRWPRADAPPRSGPSYGRSDASPAARSLAPRCTAGV